jgi:hypothetical protein
MTSLKEDLAARIERYQKSWKSMSRFYATLSILMRGSMIICSAIVAARLGLQKWTDHELTFIILGVIVAAGTALEAWFKPREKWAGFMADSDAAEDILLRLNHTDPIDSADIDLLRVEFNVLLQIHREKNVF